MFNWQDLLVYLLLATAVSYLIRKFFRKKKKKASACGTNDCSCH